MDIRLGDIFHSYREFEGRLKAFEELNRVRFATKSSKKLSYNHPDLERIGYDYIIYECKQGRRRPSTSKGFRPNQRSWKCDCAAYIRVVCCEYDKKCALKIAGVNHSHNHSQILVGDTSNFQFCAWQSEEWAREWLTRSTVDPRKAFCNFCQKNLHPVVAHLQKHSITSVHLKLAKEHNDKHYAVEKIEPTSQDGQQGEAVIDAANCTEDMWLQEAEEIVATGAFASQNDKMSSQSVSSITIDPPFITPPILTHNYAAAAPTKQSSSSSSSCCTVHDNPLWRQYMSEKIAVKKLEKERAHEEVKTQKLIQQYHRIKIKKLLGETND